METVREIVVTGLSRYKDTIYLPMLKMIDIPFNVNVNKFDYLIFTSKTSINLAYLKEPKCKDKKAIVLGMQSAKLIETLGGKTIFISKSGHAKNLVNELPIDFLSKKILWFSAKEPLFDLTKTKLDVKNVVIYETHIKEYNLSYKPKDESIILFTSPKTVEGFMHNFGWDKSYIALAIGATTKDVLLKYNIQSLMPEQKSLKSLIKLAKKHVKIYKPE